MLKRIYLKVVSYRLSIAPLYTTCHSPQRRIPCNVYQTWKESRLPFLHAWSVRRFRTLNSDHSFFFFDDIQMNEYMNVHYAGHPILKIFQDVRIPAARADIWRYCILFQQGGIYCDIDKALVVPINQILESDSTELVSFERNKWKDQLELQNYSDPAVFLSNPPEYVRANLDFPDNTILNWFLCFEKGHPILEHVIDLIVQHADFYRRKSFESVEKAVIHFSGPLVFTQAVWKWMEKSKRHPAQAGVDFQGHGVFDLPWSELRYDVSPHYTSLSNTGIMHT